VGVSSYSEHILDLYIGTLGVLRKTRLGISATSYEVIHDAYCFGGDVSNVLGNYASFPTTELQVSTGQ